MDGPCSLSVVVSLSQRPSSDRSPSRPLDVYGFVNTSTRPPLASDEVKLLWTRVFVRYNVPFNLLQAPEFRQAISATSKVGREIRLGSRTYMTKTLIPGMKHAILSKLHAIQLTCVPGVRFCLHVVASRLCSCACSRSAFLLNSSLQDLLHWMVGKSNSRRAMCLGRAFPSSTALGTC